MSLSSSANLYIQYPTIKMVQMMQIIVKKNLQESTDLIITFIVREWKWLFGLPDYNNTIVLFLLWSMMFSSRSIKKWKIHLVIYKMIDTMLSIVRFWHDCLYYYFYSGIHPYGVVLNTSKTIYGQEMSKVTPMEVIKHT